MSKIKLQIKNRFTGSIIFEYESENNTIRETLLNAIKSGANLSEADLSRANLSRANLSEANLSGANLSGANLYGANLYGANLYGANLSGANLYEANLSEANLSGANLSGANLSGADLSGADLSGADLSGADLYGANLSGADLYGKKISKICVFTGLYKYQVWAVIYETGEKYIRMGCYFRSLSEWENDFWNNPNEFPNNRSEQSELRLMAFETSKKWFDIQDKIKA